MFRYIIKMVSALSGCFIQDDWSSDFMLIMLDMEDPDSYVQPESNEWTEITDSLSWIIDILL